jgi:signal peptidase I
MNDHSRDLPGGVPADSTPAEPVDRATPEPRVSPEPLPPSAHLASMTPPEAARASEPPAPPSIEPSWRTIVGGHRDDPFRTAPAAPHDIHAPALELRAADDTTLGTLGDEPMGGIPREAPIALDAMAGAPPDPAVPTGVRPDKPSPVTLARVGEELFAWLKTLASAAVYATLIVTFGFQVARVEGQSMAPTLADQDRLIVNKLAYRLGQPQIGDIVMLYYPLNPEKSFVKRVIAEEGDTIRIVDGRVYRNDVPINDEYVPAEFRSHDDYGPEVVPQGYYFVMGDHRNNSSDSRHWKFVPKKYIIGKVQLRWWPIPHARIF